VHRSIAMPEGGRVEVFHRCPRYVTVSGQRLAGTPDALRPICDVAADLLVLAQPIGGSSSTDGTAPRPNPDAAGAPEDIAAALAQIPNADLSWDEWSTIGMATWRASGGSEAGLAAWTAWSAKSAKHSDAACQERWQHWFRSPPDRIGYASLYRLARQANPLWVKPSLVKGLATPETRVQAANADWESSTPPTVPAGSSTLPAALTATPFDPADLARLKPREWVYGHFLIRRFVSVLGAPGGTGKTAYAIAVALAVALGRPLVEEPVHSAGPVWIFNLEDPRDEILRRVQAAVIAHGIRPAELAGRLYLDSGRDQPLVVAARLPDGSVLATPVAEALIAELQRRRIILLVVDPFVKSHRLEENRNEQIDFVATLWARVADAAGCAILLVHHFRKGGTAGDADAFRGASALVDAARAAVTLSVMAERESEGFQIPPDQRRRYVRADNAKLNLAPPPDTAVWLNLRSVDLPNGDSVQAAVRWQPPTAWEGITGNSLVAVLREMAKAEQDDLWCARKQAGKRWAGKLLSDIGGRSEQQAADILKRWEKEGLLYQVEFENKSRKTRHGYKVDAAKQAEMEREFAGGKGWDD
jgi:hypothetical protein